MLLLSVLCRKKSVSSKWLLNDNLLDLTVSELHNVDALLETVLLSTAERVNSFDSWTVSLERSDTSSCNIGVNEVDCYEDSLLFSTNCPVNCDSLSLDTVTVVAVVVLTIVILHTSRSNCTVSIPIVEVTVTVTPAVVSIVSTYEFLCSWVVAVNGSIIERSDTKLCEDSLYISVRDRYNLLYVVSVSLVIFNRSLDAEVNHCDFNNRSSNEGNVDVVEYLLVTSNESPLSSVSSTNFVSTVHVADFEFAVRNNLEELCTNLGCSTPSCSNAFFVEPTVEWSIVTDFSAVWVHDANHVVSEFFNTEESLCFFNIEWNNLCGIALTNNTLNIDSDFRSSRNDSSWEEEWILNNTIAVSTIVKYQSEWNTCNIYLSAIFYIFHTNTEEVINLN